MFGSSSSSEEGSLSCMDDFGHRIHILSFQLSGIIASFQMFSSHCSEGLTERLQRILWEETNCDHGL